MAVTVKHLSDVAVALSEEWQRQSHIWREVALKHGNTQVAIDEFRKVIALDIVHLRQDLNDSRRANTTRRWMVGAPWIIIAGLLVWLTLWR